MSRANLFRLEIREVHSNAVVCVGCEIHGDPGKYDVEIAKSELARHLRKHANRVAKLFDERGLLPKEEPSGD